VTVAAEHPVVAGVRVSTVPPADESGSSSGSDFAWLASVHALRDRALVTVAAGPNAQLHLSNPTDEEAEVSIDALSGDDLDVVVPAGGSAVVDLAENTTYELGGFDTLYGSVSHRADTALASYAVLPPTTISGPIEIYP